MKKVSVVIPVYNAERYLSECLDSVVAQTLRDIEIICVNDGSRDHSLEILREYERNDSRIVVLTQENSGAGTARNNGMKLTHGEYVIFLDCDDIFDPSMLEKMYQQAVQDDVDIVVCHTDMFDDKTGREITSPWTIRHELLPEKKIFCANDVKKDFFQLFIWWPWDKLIRKSLIDRLQIEFQPLRTTNDLYFVAACCLSADSIECIDPVLVHHRTNEKGSLEYTRNKSWNCFLEALAKLSEFLHERNLYERFEQDFLNYCVSFSMWHLRTIHGPAHYKLRAELCKNTLEALHVNTLAEEDYYSPVIYQEYKEAEEKNNAFERGQTVSEPKVSVVVPCLNSFAFLYKCIDSIIDQTLPDIEILCVDAGSTDGTLEALQEYAEIDHRIRILHSPKKSYGYQMNLGIQGARGKYLGIVESDDFIESDMYERLYKCAEENDLDLAKCGFYNYYSEPKEKNMAVPIPQNAPREVFTPLNSSFLESDQFFTMSPSIWTGLYRLSFLRENHILFNETPGASYQDTAFTFKVWCCAERVCFLDECLHHYRRDNESSSSNSRGKVYCIVDEYREEERFLTEEQFRRKPRAEGIRCRLKYDGYLWNYRRLDSPYNIEFLRFAAGELKEDLKKGYLKEELFSASKWQDLLCMTEDPDSFHAVQKVRLNQDEQINVMQKITAFRKKQQILPTEDSLRTLKLNRVEDPFVSVVIPAYNIGNYIAECIESIRFQTLKNLEIICIDDGSTDSTLQEILHQAQQDDRVSVFIQSNSGVGVVRNRGARAARGKYLYFMDGDDLLAAEALQELTDQMEQEDLDILYFDADSFADGVDQNIAAPFMYNRGNYKGVFPGEELMKQMQRRGDYRMSAVMQILRRSFYLEKRLTFPEGIIHEDNQFTFISMLQAERTAHVNKPYYKRRVRADSIMTRKVSWANAYGYFKCYLAMSQFLRDHPERQFPDEAYAIVDSVCRNGRRAYADLHYLDRLTRLALPQDEQSLVKLLYDDWVKVRWEQQQKTADMERELLETRASVTYKAGRAFTWFPRKVRTALRLCRNHGLGYTVKFVFTKLHL